MGPEGAPLDAFEEGVVDEAEDWLEECQAEDGQAEDGVVV